MRLLDANVTIIVLGNNDAAGASPIARDIGAIYFGQPYTLPGAPAAGGQ